MCLEAAKSGLLYVEIACAWIGLALMWNCILEYIFLVAVELGCSFLSLESVLFVPSAKRQHASPSMSPKGLLPTETPKWFLMPFIPEAPLFQ